MNLITDIGRLLFGIPMVVFGVFHFINTQSLKNIVPAIIPGDTFWVILTGAALVAAGVSIIIKKQTQTTCYFLAIMLLCFVILIHLPNAIGGNLDSVNAVLKDTALAGGAILLDQSYKAKP